MQYLGKIWHTVYTNVDIQITSFALPFTLLFPELSGVSKRWHMLALAAFYQEVVPERRSRTYEISFQNLFYLDHLVSQKNNTWIDTHTYTHTHTHSNLSK